MSTERATLLLEDNPQPALPLVEVTEGSVDDLKSDPHNTRLHSKRNLDMIDSSVDEVGFARSIVADENNIVRAGNGTLEIARKRHAKIVYVDVNDKNTLVVVRRKNLTEIEKTRMGMQDNRASDLSRNNKDQIARLTEQYPDQPLLDGIFNNKEQQKLLMKKAYSQDLAAGGVTDYMGAVEEEENSGLDAAVTGIRMINLFIPAAEHAALHTRIRQLAILPEIGGANITEQIIAITNYAWEQLIGQQVQAAEEVAEVVKVEEPTTEVLTEVSIPATEGSATF